MIDLEQHKKEKLNAPEMQENKKMYAKLHNMNIRLKQLESMMLKVDKEKLMLSKDPKKKQKSNTNEDNV